MPDRLNKTQVFVTLPKSDKGLDYEEVRARCCDWWRYIFAVEIEFMDEYWKDIKNCNVFVGL